MAEVNAKSVLSTTFQLGTFPMPIRLYKSTDIVGLSGQLFHDGCGGKIRQWKSCENHPNIEDPATFSGIAVGNRIVPLTKELKSSLFDGETEFSAIGAFKLQRLSDLIIDQSIVIMDGFEMVPEQYFEIAFSTLLDRLRVRRQFVLAVYAQNCVKRYGILLPSGIFLPIRYSEEIRSKRFRPSTIDRQFGREINDALDSLASGDFPTPSAESMLSAVQQWFTNVALGKKIVAYTHRIKEKVNA